MKNNNVLNFKRKPITSPSKFGLKPLTDYEEEDLDWIWYPYFARGQLTLVEGDPDARKSFMLQAASRAIVDGITLPSRFPTLQTKPGNIVFFDCENAGSTVMKRRFRYLGLKNEARIFLKEDPFLMTDKGIDGIIETLRQINPLIVIFDTMNDYFDRWANTGNGRDVTQALQPFGKLARSLSCSVVLVRHLTKDSTKKALYRGQGNISYMGKARISITVALDEEDASKSYMVPSKLNLEARPGAIEYYVHDKSTLAKRGAFEFKWGNLVAKTADDILRTHGEPGRPSDQRDEAVEFLREALVDGPVEVERIDRMAMARKLSMSTVRRAADDLNIKKEKVGRKWRWSLRQLSQN